MIPQGLGSGWRNRAGSDEMGFEVFIVYLNIEFHFGTI